MLVCLLAGCATSGDDVASITLSFGGTRVPGAPVEVYTRVARGAKACWFGAGQPLVTGYIFAADVRPADKGGAAEIAVYDTANDNRRGLKAFTVTIVQAGADGLVPDANAAAQSLIGTSNARIAEPFAQQMQSDALRWASGETNCAADGQWSPQAPAEPEPPAKAPAKAKAKKPAIKT